MKRVEKRRWVSPSKVKDEAVGVGRKERSFTKRTIDYPGIEFTTDGKTEYL